VPAIAIESRCGAPRRGEILTLLLAECLLGAVGDEPRDGQRRGRGGRRRVADVQRAVGLREDEVVDEPAVAPERLRAYAGERGLDVARAQLRYVPRGGADEGPP